MLEVSLCLSVNISQHEHWKVWTGLNGITRVMSWLVCVRSAVQCELPPLMWFKLCWLSADQNSVFLLTFIQTHGDCEVQSKHRWLAWEESLNLHAHTDAHVVNAVWESLLFNQQSKLNHPWLLHNPVWYLLLKRSFSLQSYLHSH